MRSPKLLGFLLFLMLFATRAQRSAALLCHCTAGEWCDLSSNVCRTADSAACVTYHYGHNTSRLDYLCSESGLECPRDEDPPGLAGSKMECCRHNFCNSMLGQGSDQSGSSIFTPPNTSNPGQAITYTVPPSADGKLRCDCTPRAGGPNCRKDKGTRGRHHCIVHGGWCAAESIRDPFTDQVRPTRFCTTRHDSCLSSTSSTGNVRCCSDARFCNEHLHPELPLVVVEETNTTDTGYNGTTWNAGDVPKERWCHCNNGQQCNESFRYCRTTGRCQTKIEPYPLGATHQCIPPNETHLCTAQNPCCDSDCCNGRYPCRHRPRLAPPVLPPVGPTPTKYTCHCSNCPAHKCTTSVGCMVDVNSITNTSHQDCIRSEMSSRINCSPSFSIGNAVSTSRTVGAIHSHCCRGDRCNSHHPDYPRVKPERILQCKCMAPRCATVDITCQTSQHGGQCYRGPAGEFCIEPQDTDRLTLLCKDGKHCCNTSMCHEENRMLFDTSTSSSVSSEAVGGKDSSKTVFNALYIGLAVSAVFLLCSVTLLIVIVCRRHKLRGQRSVESHGASKQPAQSCSRHSNPVMVVSKDGTGECMHRCGENQTTSSSSLQSTDTAYSPVISSSDSLASNHISQRTSPVNTVDCYQISSITASEATCSQLSPTSSISNGTQNAEAAATADSAPCAAMAVRNQDNSSVNNAEEDTQTL